MSKATELNYLYLITYRREFKELCALEMKYIFNSTDSDLYHFTNDNIDISTSTFFKARINIMYKSKHINDIETQITKDKLTFHKYKIRYIKLDDTKYQERLSAMRICGTAIEGDFEIKNPLIDLALTRIEGEWVLGYYEPNPNEWISRRKKPFNYSHALEVKLAKSLVNLATSSQKNLLLVDPCCGIGTVLIEARSNGITIDGFEMNSLVAEHCNVNLQHFNFNPDVRNMDMHNISNHYDVAIIDIPYGQFSNITLKEQISLLKKTKEISNKAVILTMDDMTNEILELGYNITDTCIIEKSNAFKRHIYICK